MEKKKHLYRGKKNLDYENAFSDNKKSQKKIKEHKLDMTLTDVEYKFDNSKILFYFLSFSANL